MASAVRADTPRAALAGDGRVVVVELGSSCPDRPDGAAYVYDPSTDALADAPSPPLRNGLAMTAMGDGRILIAGGVGAESKSSIQTYLWDLGERHLG